MEKTVEIEAFKAGRKEKGAGYHFFVPEAINRQWYWKDAELGTLLEKASISLGELNSFSRLVPDIDLFIKLHVTKEAVISSRIEGTKTNIDEALLPEEDIAPERRDDWQEVNNYSLAMQQAIARLEKLPLSSRLIRQAHKKLLSGVRGKHKMPGEFRSSQNWIGGATLADAIFVPPPHIYINELMGDLEKFLHNDTIQVPSLIRIGIAHYQFETIHPFLDGNGRIGRLLITLYLVSEGIMQKPLLYLSAFFEKNRSAYYDNLTRVREKNDMMHWLKYFLTGVDVTARQASKSLEGVLKLKENAEIKIHNSAGKRLRPALELLTYLFRNPIVDIRQVEEVCGLSFKSANNLVSFFEEGDILHEISGKARYKMYSFKAYTDLFK